MKGHKIDVKGYPMQGRPDLYKIKEVISNIICHPSQEHKGYRFYTVNKVADKIISCKEDYIILDKTDYEIVKNCFDSFKGFGPADKEMVARIYEAEEVEVDITEKKEKT